MSGHWIKITSYKKAKYIIKPIITIIARNPRQEPPSHSTRIDSIKVGPLFSFGSS